MELKEWQKQTLELRSQGLSSRAICREFGWEETKKSTINSFLQRYDALNEIVEDGVKQLNILYWDIETSPTVSAHWGQWQQNIPYVAKIRDGHMLSHAWCWNDGEVQASTLTHLEAKEADDERLVLEMWSLFDKADVIVGHNCMEENSKILTKNLEWVEVKNLAVGDELIGFDEGKSPFKPFRDQDGSWLGQGSNRMVKTCKVTEHTMIQKEAFEVTLSDGSKVTTTEDHFWLGKTSKKGVLTWIRTKDLIKRNAHIVKYMNVWEVDDSYEAGWLSGFIDGEGSLVQSEHKALSGIQVCQRPTKVWKRFLDYLDYYGIKHAAPYRKAGGLGRGDCEYTNVHGKWDTLELIGKFDITKFKETLLENGKTLGTLTSCGRPTLRVVSVKSVGVKNIVILGTDSSTYFAEGFAMHNCKKFDIAKANASFLKYGMKPPSPYKTIDTLAIARKKFNLPFKNLDFLCQYLNLPYQKVKHEGMDLWMKCMEGDVEALTAMKHYNIGDIPTLRALYKRLSVWDNNSVNFGTLLGDRSKCPSCASDILTDTNNFVYTSAKGYSVFRCECGALCKQTKQGFSLI